MYYCPYALKILKEKHNKILNDPNITILYLKGSFKSENTNEIHYIDGMYMLNPGYSELYKCFPLEEPDEYGYHGKSFVLKKREIIKLCQAVIRSKEPDKWRKRLIYLDGKNKNQPADTFNGTLLYVVIMLLLTVFNDRIIGWIGATVFYLIWKSSKYN